MGCPGFIDREQNLNGLFVVDTLLAFNQDTNLIEVKEYYPTLKHFVFGDYYFSYKAVKEWSFQTFAFKTIEEALFFSDGRNFADRSEWYKALKPYSFEPMRFGEPLEVFLDRISQNA